MSTMDAKQTSPEIERAQKYIEQARIGVIGATIGLSTAQWDFKPAPDRWSIRENLEHIVIVQELVSGIVQGDPTARPIGDPGYIDNLVLREFPSRLAKFKGPEFAMPTGRVSPQESFELAGQKLRLACAARRIRARTSEAFISGAADQGRDQWTI